jgi:Rieske Fe-S protein
MKDKNRRLFLEKAIKVIGTVTVTTPFINLLNSCENYWENTNENELIEIELDLNDKKYSRLNSIGQGIIIAFGKANYGVPVIIVKIDDKNYKCYSSMCTHNNCFGVQALTFFDIPNSNVRPPIGMTGDNRHIVCTCHGSRFDAFDNAKVVQGPAERPLKQFKTEFNPETKLLKLFLK